MIFNAYAEQKEQVSGITLVSCGHIFAKSGREIFRPKGREDWLLFYIAKGDETFYLPSPIKGKAGSFILFAPNETQHHIYNGEGTAEFYYVHFKGEHLPAHLTLQTSTVYDLPYHRTLCDTFEEIMEELTQKAPQYETLCLYRFLGLLTRMEREITHRAHPQMENRDRIARAIQHMNRFHDSPFTLEDYAAICHMSKFHFIRVFEQTVGTSPMEYRNHIRLEHAAELLRHEGYSVEEISQMTGFASASYFSSAFKRKFGISPKQYRRT